MLSTAICARILGVHSGSGAARVLEACRGAWLVRLEEVAEGRHVFKNMNEKKSCSALVLAHVQLNLRSHAYSLQADSPSFGGWVFVATQCSLT